MGRALLAALPGERREALLNEISVKTPDEWNTFRDRVLRASTIFMSEAFACRTAICGVKCTPSPADEACGRRRDSGVQLRLPSYLLKENS